jgi:hypothetical protein
MAATVDWLTSVTTTTTPPTPTTTTNNNNNTCLIDDQLVRVHIDCLGMLCVCHAIL